MRAERRKKILFCFNCKSQSETQETPAHQPRCEPKSATQSERERESSSSHWQQHSHTPFGWEICINALLLRFFSIDSDSFFACNFYFTFFIFGMWMRNIMRKLQLGDFLGIFGVLRIFWERKSEYFGNEFLTIFGSF